LLKHNHQKGRSTVDWAQWHHNTTVSMGPTPRSYIGPRTCQGRRCLKLLSFIWSRHNCVSCSVNRAQSTVLSQPHCMHCCGSCMV